MEFCMHCNWTKDPQAQQACFKVLNSISMNEAQHMLKQQLKHKEIEFWKTWWPLSLQFSYIMFIHNKMIRRQLGRLTFPEDAPNIQILKLKCSGDRTLMASIDHKLIQSHQVLKVAALTIRSCFSFAANSTSSCRGVFPFRLALSICCRTALSCCSMMLFSKDRKLCCAPSEAANVF